jgi:hypothetical protein
MNSNLRRRLKAIADDLRGPLGRIPLDRVLGIVHIELTTSRGCPSGRHDGV